MPIVIDKAREEAEVQELTDNSIRVFPADVVEPHITTMGRLYLPPSISGDIPDNDTTAPNLYTNLLMNGNFNMMGDDILDMNAWEDAGSTGDASFAVEDGVLTLNALLGENLRVSTPNMQNGLLGYYHLESWTESKTGTDFASRVRAGSASTAANYLALTPINVGYQSFVYKTSNINFHYVNFLGTNTGVTVISDMILREIGQHWTWNDGWNWVSDGNGGGRAHCDGTQIAATSLLADVQAKTGTTYYYSFEVLDAVGTVNLMIGDVDTGSVNAPGTYSDTITTTAGGDIEFIAGASFVGTIDNVVIVEVN